MIEYAKKLCFFALKAALNATILTLLFNLVNLMWTPGRYDLFTAWVAAFAALMSYSKERP